jgi:hypothetical protein
MATCFKGTRFTRSGHRRAAHVAKQDVCPPAHLLIDGTVTEAIHICAGGAEVDRSHFDFPDFELLTALLYRITVARWR